MVSPAPAGGSATDSLIVTGLGPGNLERVPAMVRALLEDPARTIVVRTIHHPAATELAGLRSVETCDDLYEQFDDFDEVYSAIVERVLAHAAQRPTVYAVPGSPLVGEFAVGKLLELHPGIEVIPAESFVDALLHLVAYDPLSRGLRIINGHELPDPLVLDCPTIIGHLDAPAVLADVASALARVLPEGAEVLVCANLAADDEVVVAVPVDGVPAEMAGFRTSLFVDTLAAGLVGVVAVSRRLRRECPWDREQTHHSLVAHLVEEVNELIEAIAALPPDDTDVDYAAYDGVEEELGDVLLQVLFHSAIAAQRGVFGIDDVATRLQEKLVRRHPHVFGDVTADTSAQVASNWERIKAAEKGGSERASLMDDVPAGVSALERAAHIQRRAAEVGFDWERAGDVVDVLRDEVTELRSALAGRGDPADELGDVLFTAVNLARHIDASPEVILHRATARFERRFRAMEETGSLAGLGLDVLEEIWQAAKREVG